MRFDMKSALISTLSNEESDKLQIGEYDNSNNMSNYNVQYKNLIEIMKIKYYC